LRTASPGYGAKFPSRDSGERADPRRPQGRHRALRARACQGTRPARHHGQRGGARPLRRRDRAVIPGRYPPERGRSARRMGRDRSSHRVPVHPDAQWITAQTIRINGGMTALRHSRAAAGAITTLARARGRSRIAVRFCPAITGQKRTRKPSCCWCCWWGRPVGGHAGRGRPDGGGHAGRGRPDGGGARRTGRTRRRRGTPDGTDQTEAGHAGRAGPDGEETCCHSFASAQVTAGSGVRRRSRARTRAGAGAA
jgi:hypothetical protein